MILFPEDQAAFAHAWKLALRGDLDLNTAVVDDWLLRDELDLLVANCRDCDVGFPCEGPEVARALRGCANTAILGAFTPASRGLDLRRVSRDKACRGGHALGPNRRSQCPIHTCSPHLIWAL
jgi:hypothetical protein